MEITYDDVKKIYDNINTIISLNFLVFDEDNNLKYRFDSYEISDNIQDYEKYISKDIKVATSIKDETYVYFFESEIKLRYMACGLYENAKYIGNIIVGPYLNSEVVSMVDRLRSIKDFPQIVPIIDTQKERSIAYILKNLVSKDFINVSYLELNNKNKILKNVKKIIDNNDMNIVSVRKGYLMENDLIHAININDLEKALTIVSDKFFQSRYKTLKCDLKDKKNFALDMNSLIRRVAIDSNVDIYTVHKLSEKFICDIESLNEIKEVDKIIKQIVIEYCNLINANAVKGYSNLISKSIDYITNNFMNHISLKDVANSVLVNSSHLARRFKSETGQTVSYFINNCRIREAKFLLKNRNYTIEEIAYKVGYSNKIYFTKIFKQFENITPKEYRLSGDD